MTTNVKNIRGGYRRRLMLDDEEIEIPMNAELMDRTAVIIGYKMTENGELEPGRKVYATDFTKVKADQTYRIVTGLDYYACWVCWYSKDKSFLSSTNYMANYQAHGYNFYPPDGACFVRFTGYDNPQSVNWGSIKRVA